MRISGDQFSDGISGPRFGGIAARSRLSSLQTGSIRGALRLLPLLLISP
jgi:hypothetical protein